MGLQGKEAPYVLIEDMKSTTPEPIEAVSAGVLGLVGDFSEGPTGVARVVYSWSGLYDLFGGLRNDLAAPWEAAGYYAQGPNLPAYIVRVVGEGAVKATLALQDDTPEDTLVLTAWGEGAWGNELAVEVSDPANGETGFFRLKLRRTNPDTSTYQELDYGDVTMDSSSPYYAVEVVNAWDKWVVASDAGAVTRPANTGEFSAFTSGASGAAPDDTAFIGAEGPPRTGGFLLDEIDEVTLIRYAGRSSEGANNAAIARAAARQDAFAVITIGEGAASTVAAIIVALTSGRYAAAYHNKIYVANPLTGGKKAILPGGHIAGHLAARPPHYSPAYLDMRGIIGITRQLSRGDIETITLAGACPLVREPKKVGARKVMIYKLANGLTLATEERWSQVSKVRKAMQIIESMYEGLQVYKSAPNTFDHRQTLKAALESLLAPMKRDQGIIDYVIDAGEELNPPAIQRQRIVRARLGIAYIHPGDYIWMQVDHDWNSGGTSVS